MHLWFVPGTVITVELPHEAVKGIAGAQVSMIDIRDNTPSRQRDSGLSGMISRMKEYSFAGVSLSI